MCEIKKSRTVRYNNAFGDSGLEALSSAYTSTDLFKSVHTKLKRDLATTLYPDQAAKEILTEYDAYGNKKVNNGSALKLAGYEMKPVGNWGFKNSELRCVFHAHGSGSLINDKHTEPHHAVFMWRAPELDGVMAAAMAKAGFGNKPVVYYAYGKHPSAPPRNKSYDQIGAAVRSQLTK